MKKFIDLEAMRKINWKEAYIQEAKTYYEFKYIFVLIALIAIMA